MRNESLEEELNTLRLIYGAESVAFSEETGKLRLHLPSQTNNHDLVLQCCIRAGYPATDSLSKADMALEASWLADDQVQALWRALCRAVDLEDTTTTTVAPRAPAGTLCSVASWLYEARQRILEERDANHKERQQSESIRSTDEGNIARLKGSYRARSGPLLNSLADDRTETQSSTETTVKAVPVTRSNPEQQAGVDQVRSLSASMERLVLVSAEPFTERKSTFQGHAAIVTSSPAVEHCLQMLRENRKGRHATHVMWAFRIDLSEGISLEECDDDGEHRAGRLLLELLRKMCQKNVLVCVSRWFGGVLLHERRFYCIQLAAKRALAALQAADKVSLSRQAAGHGSSAHA
ncbi:hypothetical protein F1559_000853 [Cyanidiococcus yangmingshanensis]|uniref:Impact N-terminal domain-containing protein n=1 Tax=Cyanidiococcus yangmingshanensis TaxID=2690220 RepID=A0A7J7IJ98_9RHOD|nr:hypothetical protein F1559_000853 [Cyanidiococcus yangmingshanensis]